MLHLLSVEDLSEAIVGRLTNNGEKDFSEKGIQVCHLV
jgi:hypothetical protein